MMSIGGQLWSGNAVLNGVRFMYCYIAQMFNFGSVLTGDGAASNSLTCI
ncbi:hypothetical protein Pjdr2_3794 [Paenibacillus sp. JDR-2]|nr:hypothetical protein Pjdr2_3794 [Paenibacillus sp. JDR-2]